MLSPNAALHFISPEISHDYKTLYDKEIRSTIDSAVISDGPTEPSADTNKKVDRERQNEIKGFLVCVPS